MKHLLQYKVWMLGLRTTGSDHSGSHSWSWGVEIIPPELPGFFLDERGGVAIGEATTVLATRK